MCALMRYLSLGHVRFSVGTRALQLFYGGGVQRRTKKELVHVPAPQNHHSLVKDTTAKKNAILCKP